MDFVLVKGMQPISLETKAAEMREFKINRSLRSFLNTYDSKEAYVINLTLKGGRRIENTEVSFITPADLLELEL